MEILYFFASQNTLMYKWQYYHIFHELEIHNCNITVFNPLEFNSIEDANDILFRKIITEPYDLFMTPHNDYYLYIETVNLIKKTGVPTLLICFDNLVVPFMHKKICRYFDITWLTSYENIDLFIKWGANCIFLPYAANPFFFKPQIYEIEEEELCFIGTPYGSRANMINQIIESDIPISLHFKSDNIVEKRIEQNMEATIIALLDLMKFRNGRKILLGKIIQIAKGNKRLNTNKSSVHIFPPVPLEELSNNYSKYALALSSTYVRNTGVLKNPVDIVNLRSFEIPMCGGLQICAYNKELANYFEENNEIIFYSNMEEMTDKIRFYLQPDQAQNRKSMKQAARKRAENEHTWFLRFYKIFSLLGIN